MRRDDSYGKDEDQDIKIMSVKSSILKAVTIIIRSHELSLNH